jgi:hypothetical protein
MVGLKKSREGMGNDIWHLSRQAPCEMLKISVALRQEY